MRIRTILSIVFFFVFSFLFLSVVSTFSVATIYWLETFITDAPIIFPMFFMFYCLIDTFTPNPSHSSIINWLYGEFLEHIAIPIIVLFSATIIPIGVVMPIVVFYFYGFVLGKIRIDSNLDLAKIFCLMSGFIILSYFPDLLFAINTTYDVGIYFIIVSTSLVGGIYFINKLRLSLKTKSFETFFKGYILFVLCGGSIALTLEIVRILSGS